MSSLVISKYNTIIEFWEQIQANLAMSLLELVENLNPTWLIFLWMNTEKNEKKRNAIIQSVYKFLLSGEEYIQIVDDWGFSNKYRRDVPHPENYAAVS